MNESYANKGIKIYWERPGSKLLVGESNGKGIKVYYVNENVGGSNEAIASLYKRLNGRGGILVVEEDGHKIDVIPLSYGRRTSHNVPYANVKYPERYSLMTKQHKNQKKESLQQAYREVAGF